MATDRQNYSAQTLEFMKQMSEQNRLNRIAISKPLTPLWKAALAGLLTAFVIVAVEAAALFYLLHW